MSLSVARNIALFQILDTQYVDGSNVAGYSILDGMGSTTSTVSLAGPTSYQAATAINTWVNNMSAEAITALCVYLDRWIALGTSTIRVENGQVDDVGSVTKDPREEREQIRQLVVTLVPFYKIHEVMAKRAGIAANGFNVSVNR